MKQMLVVAIAAVLTGVGSGTGAEGDADTKARERATLEESRAKAKAAAEEARRALVEKIKPFLRQVDPKLVEQAAEEAQQPVRPGEPGKQEFWNIRHLGGLARFIYPPSVGFEEVPGAAQYRYDVYPKNAKTPVSFEADKPWRPLTPIWKKLPSGASAEIRYTLKVVALDAAGKEMGSCKYKIAVGGGADGHPAKGSSEQRLPNGMRPVVWGNADVLAFQKMPPFSGPYLDPIGDFDQAILERLRQMRDSPNVGYDFTMVPLKSDETMSKFGVPGNGEFSTAVYLAMSTLTRLEHLTPDAAEKKQAVEMAQRAGDWLIRDSRRAQRGSGAYSSPPGIPHTYHGFVIHVHRAGLGYLDLYRTTKDPKWLTAAEDLAQTLAGIQQPSGTWTWTTVDNKGKTSFAPMIAFFGLSCPEFDASEILYFYGRLRKEAGCTRFVEVEKKALQWVMDNSAKTFYWRDHPLNDGPHRPLGNVSLSVVNYFVRYLLEYAEPTEENLKLADEALRFCEDQYINWGRSADGLGTPTVGRYGEETALFATIYAKMYERTKRPLDLAKAEALANAALRDMAGNFAPLHLREYAEVVKRVKR